MIRQMAFLLATGVALGIGVQATALDAADAVPCTCESCPSSHPIHGGTLTGCEPVLGSPTSMVYCDYSSGYTYPVPCY